MNRQTRPESTEARPKEPTWADLDRFAKANGMNRAKGTYNGLPYWMRTTPPYIIDRARMLEMMGY